MENKKITVGDILCNRDFDTNCQYCIFEGTNEDENLLWDSNIDGYISLDDDIASHNISYITIRNNILYLEIL